MVLMLQPYYKTQHGGIAYLSSTEECLVWLVPPTGTIDVEGDPVPEAWAIEGPFNPFTHKLID